ncbi:MULTISPECIES: polysaccharide pyruvyl transferase family protein [unclassified Sinorhizobium]|uniref:polysaccharide pyruvyl transferase family protein n=1 Tax=unclassified Sinorhizobium TaxID=2613772 RepID=UPI0035262E92
MKIGLLGQFGSGNTGNDGSLEAMVNFLRKTRSDAELLCICSNPDAIAKQYKIKAIGIGGTIAQGRWFQRINGVLAGVPRRFLTLYSLFGQLDGLTLLIIPGTGILDDFQENPFGWPFVVFRWCLAARLRRIRIAFVSIGAGPIEHPLSRWFLKAAAQMAQYRSYRDDYSLQYVESIGVDVSRDWRYPDIAFRLPVPDPLPVKNDTHITVGVGVMDYHGWSKTDTDADAIHQNYTGKLAAYIGWLLEQGYNVRLLTGDLRDGKAVKKVLDKIAATGSDVSPERITSTCSQSLHELMDTIAQTDFVIVSRYHNVVSALKLGRPTISLSYNKKNDYLLAQFGQQHYCQNIETFDVEELKRQTQSVMENIDAVRLQIDNCNRALQEKLSEQEALLLDRVISPRRERIRRQSGDMIRRPS